MVSDLVTNRMAQGIDWRYNQRTLRRLVRLAKVWSERIQGLTETDLPDLEAEVVKPDPLVRCPG
jgi:hypothetical protein